MGDSDDPWDWKVDRVVRELCTDQRTWNPRAAHRLPEPLNLETVLRKHEVEGEFLLTEFDKRNMIQDFLGITEFKETCTIKSAISQLRTRSKKYRLHEQALQLRGSHTMDGSDDPWDWKVDRVVRELCTDQRTWNLRTGYRLPEPLNFETVLRKHEVEGELLLTEFDEHDTIRDFLGIAEFKETCAFKSAISQLRACSKQYRLYNQALNEPLHLRGPHITRDPGASLEASRDVRDGTTFIGTQSRANIPDSVVSATAEVPSISYRSGVPDVEFIRNKRRKLYERPFTSTTDVSFYEDDMQHQDNSHAIAQETAEMPDPVNGATGRKRKRLAPTLITSIVDQSRDRTIPTEADNVKLNDPHNIEPGQAFRDESGRKRMIPVRLNEPDEQHPFDYATIISTRTSASKALENGGEEAFEAAKNIIADKPRAVQLQNISSLSKGYLGRQENPVDNLFYGTSQVGGELATSNPSEFLHASKISNGRRLYVHNIMKKYLANPQEKIFERDGKIFSAVQPYSAQLIKKHCQPSFTLYRSTLDGEVHATREEISKWPEVTGGVYDPSKIKPSDQDQFNATFLLPNDGGTEDDGSWDYLEKYRHMEGADEVLPAYGDSGSEGEYDVDTWREIEDENGILDRPILKSRRTPLTPEEVNQTIDEGIAELVVKWNETKLPKCQRNAWKMWKRSRLNNSKRVRISELQKGLDRIKNQRLVSLREKIASEVWTSAQQLRKQTKIMEQSIFDRELFRWEIDMLEQKQCPARPSDEELAKLKSKKAIQDKAFEDADGESIGSSDASSDSADELDDFIVEDDVDGIRSDALTDDQLADMEAVDLDGQDGNFDDSDDAAMSPGNPHIGLPDRGLSIQTESNDVDILDTNHNEGNVLGPSKPSFSTPEPTMVAKFEPTSSAIPIKSELISAVPHLEPGSCIDLTGDSTEDSTEKLEIIDLTTPRKSRSKASSVVSSDSPSRRTSKFKMPRMVDDSRGQNDKSSDTEDDSVDNTPGDKPVPPLRDVVAIGKLPYKLWQRKNDRLRLVISVLQKLEEPRRARILNLHKNTDQDQLWEHMEVVMAAIINNKSSARGLDADSFKTLTDIIRIFEMYVDCQHHKLSVSILPSAVAKLKRRKILHWEGFFRLCHKINTGFEDDSDDEMPDQCIEYKTSTPDSDSMDDGIQSGSPVKKKSRRIFENTDARAQRDQDHQRLKEQEERRRNLHKKLGLLASTDSTKIIINDSKSENQGLVYVHRDIAERIKKHQIDGVRFMWRQVVNDGSNSIGEQGLEGCLLAHTMGLGKTMQVITLLVAIAEAAASPHESISSQIPEHLRQSKTLILCPPGLIDNWMDELLIWAPLNVLGHLRKVGSSMKQNERFMNITQWFNDGGVLVIGYQMFRQLINSANRLDEDDHNRLEKELLQGPNLVIADEAHSMKNSKSTITVVANRFKSKSRIALTGSPLANNVTEYHTMIDWVAPNYLGPIAEFRAKYVDPIETGLYKDSTPGERRKALKMLGVLKEDLSPKVNRADMSVIRDSLPPKTEFVITLALTELQSQAYSIYVDRMLSRESSGGMTKMGEISQTTIWHWLAILILLCNHPTCFKDKLTERKEDARAVIAEADAQIGSPNDDIGSADNISPWKVGVTNELVQQEMQLFEKINNIKDIKYSKKVQILMQILDFCRDIGDKVLVFSTSITSLDYLEHLCKIMHRIYRRLDGSTNMNERQGATKDFNRDETEVYLISTRAGGLGLNLFGANRVVIFDFLFNPVHEEQAIGRAYRIGQQKPVYVYRFVMGGTFEEFIHNKTVFKKQLASSVVDRKQLQAMAKKKSVGDFLFHPRDVEVRDISEYRGIDEKVLDRIMDSQDASRTIRNIVQEDSFQRYDDEELTAEEKKEVEQMLDDEKLKRRNPIAYAAMIGERHAAVQRGIQAKMAAMRVPISATASSQSQYTSPLPQYGKNHTASSTPLSANAPGPLPVESASGAPQSSASSPIVLSLPGLTLQPVPGTNTKTLPDTSDAADAADLSGVENSGSTELNTVSVYKSTHKGLSVTGVQAKENSTSGSASGPKGSSLTLAERLKADRLSRSPRWPHAWEVAATSDNEHQPDTPTGQQSNSGIFRLLKDALRLVNDKVSSSNPRDLQLINRMCTTLENLLELTVPLEEKRESAAKALAARFDSPIFTEKLFKAYDGMDVYNFVKDFTDTLQDSSSTSSNNPPKNDPHENKSIGSSHILRPVSNQSARLMPTIPPQTTNSSGRSSPQQSQGISNSNNSKIISSSHTQPQTAREPIPSQHHVASNPPTPRATRQTRQQASSPRSDSATPRPSKTAIPVNQGLEEFVNDIGPLNDEDQKGAVRVFVSAFERLLKDNEGDLTLALKGRPLYLKLGYDMSLAIAKQYSTRRMFHAIAHNVLAFLNEHHDCTVDLATQKRSADSLIASIKTPVINEKIKPITAVEISQHDKSPSQVGANSSNLSHAHGEFPQQRSSFAGRAFNAATSLPRLFRSQPKN